MNAQWIVSFNDGQRISSKNLEGNPWKKILSYLSSNSLNANGENKKITHIELIVNGVRYNSPTLSKKSTFQGTEEIGKFWILYKDTALVGVKDSNAENFMAYSYRLGNYRSIFWVNTKTNHTYQQILDIVNPKNKIEKSFISVEQDIENSYRELNGSKS